MTSKEKAEIIVESFILKSGDLDIEKYAFFDAKIYAKIAVDEVLIIISSIDGTDYWQDFYEEVKQEIEKM